MFPLVSSARREDEFTSPIRWVSDLIRIVGGFLPGFAKTWIDGYARAPGSFILLALLAGGLMWWGTRIASRISVQMGTIWRGVGNAPSGLPNDFIYRLRSSRGYVAFHEKLKYRWAPAFFALLFVYLGLCLASHLLYNVQDVAGFTCTESTTTRTLNDKGEKSSGSDPVRYVRVLQADGNHGRERRKIPCRDQAGKRLGRRRHTRAAGRLFRRQSAVLVSPLLLAMVVPLRRETTQDWFHVVLRYGSVGGEEDFIEPDPDDYNLEATIKPKRSGEVFVFVNDAVVGIPGLYDLFYRRNKGTATLTITRK